MKWNEREKDWRKRERESRERSWGFEVSDTAKSICRPPRHPLCRRLRHQNRLPPPPPPPPPPWFLLELSLSLSFLNFLSPKIFSSLSSLLSLFWCGKISIIWLECLALIHVLQFSWIGFSDRSCYKTEKYLFQFFIEMGLNLNKPISLWSQYFPLNSLTPSQSLSHHPHFLSLHISH